MADEPRSVTTHDLLAMKERGERIVVLTCYDALFARLLDAAGVDLLLVGDSVNQVLAGAETTLSATLEQMIYHTKIVRRSEEHTSELQSLRHLVCRLLLEKKKKTRKNNSARRQAYGGSRGRPEDTSQ